MEACSEQYRAELTDQPDRAWGGLLAPSASILGRDRAERCLRNSAQGTATSEDKLAKDIE